MRALIILKTADCLRLLFLSAIWGASFLFMRIVVPVLGVLWGAVFLNEQVTLAHLEGGMLIAVALYLVLKPQGTK